MKLALVLNLLFLSVCGKLAAADPMTFEVYTTGGICHGCTWIQADGEITPDTPDLFRESGLSPSYYVVFNSPGGDLSAALELGRLIRAGGYSTGVGRSVLEDGMPVDGRIRELLRDGATCNSACAYAYLGGVDRFTGDDELLGFHQFYDPAMFGNSGAGVEALEFLVDTVRDEVMTGNLVEYLIDMDVDLRLYELAASVGPNEPIRMLAPEDINDLGLSGGDFRLHGWTVRSRGQGLAAEATDELREHRLQLYCTANQAFWLDIITARPVPGFGASGVAQVVSRDFGDDVPMAINDYQYVGRVDAVREMPETGEVVITIELDHDEVVALARGGRHTASDEVSYIDLPALEPFSFTISVEQPEAALNVFRLCV